MPTLTQTAEFDHAFSLDAIEPPQIVPTQSLADWYASEAAWYRQLETETAELVAEVLRRLELSVRFHRVNTPRELIAQSFVYRRANLDAIEVPIERRAKLAEMLECDAGDFLLTPTEASFLAAWAILQLADQAHELGARDAFEFESLRRVAEANGDVLDAFI